VVSSFLCPSDGNAGKGGFINSYASSMGTSTFGYPQGNPPTPQQNSTGAFAYQQNFSLAQFTDGTSNTIAYSEFVVNNPLARAPGRSTQTGLKTASLLDVNSTGLANVQMDMVNCTTAYQGGQQGNGPGNTWATGAMGYTMFNTVVPPNGGGQVKWSACRNGCCPQAQHADLVVATSLHSGGVNALFADGSVKFIKNTISIPTWWALGTRGNGEVISADAY